MSFLLRSCSDQKAKQAQKYISIERKVKNQKDKKMTIYIVEVKPWIL